MAQGALTAPDLPSQAELRSFARVAAHLLAEHPTPALGSRTVRRRAGLGLQHLDHRDYVAGDEIRHIDWRQTARRQRLIVRQFEAETSGDWFLMLDASSSMTTHDERKWHAAVCATTALSFALLELGHRVAVIGFASDVVAEIPPGRGARHFPAVVQTLRKIRPSKTGARSNLVACVRRLFGTASAFVLSDFLGPSELRPDLAALRERCVQLHALQTHDPGDLALAASGPVELFDVETGATAPAEPGARTESAARTAHAERVLRLRRFAARSGMAFSSWNVADPWQRVLLDHFVRARAA
jgi:uncharacterized protein (DUF58 family)